MAVHTDLSKLVEEAISEYLTTVRLCLDYRKPDGGCLGYPAALLMLCLINAFGTYLAGEEVTIEGRAQRVTPREPFRVLNHSLFGQQLTHVQIKRIEHAYRNRLAHNAMLDPDSWLLPPGIPGGPFVFRGDRVGNSLEVSKIKIHKVNGVTRK